MNSLAFQITAELLPLIRKIFSNKYSDITSVKIIWHNLIFLTISKVNCLFLSEKHATNISDLVSIEIMPESIKQFEKDYAIFLGTQIDDLANTIYQQKPNLSILRECILSIELCISQTEVNIKEGKSSRDTTGSYYTPYQLAESVVHKALSTKHSKSLLAQKGRTLRIADLSCGGGEFFWAAQQYLEKECCIPYEVSALFFWGMDVDPIALQITICRLLKTSNVADWKEIAGHFLLGNPLISSNTQESLDCKNELFALNRIYASKMGVNYSSIEELRFDIILGNPPWEKTRFEERKFFSCYEPQISKLAKKDDREQAINELSDTWPELSKWVTELSNDYKVMCSKAYKHPFIKHAVSGELNTYVLFTELAYSLLSETGICSLIVKSTLATAPAHKGLWSYLLREKALVALYFFENKHKIFNIDSRERFAVITMSKIKQASFAFSAGLLAPADMYACSEVIVNESDVVAINPFTKMIPNVSCTEDLKVLVEIHNRLPLFQEVYPNCHFGRLIHLTAHAKQIDTVQKDDNIPVYEGKFIEQYDGRYSTFAGMSDSKKYAAKATATKNVEKEGIKPLPESRFFVERNLWDKYTAQYNEAYSLCWRSLTSPTNARTTIAMILPSCPTCQSIQMLQTDNMQDLLMMLALFNSLPFDYFVRLKMPGIDLTQSVIKQIPVPSRASYDQQLCFNKKTCTLKNHIFSCFYYLLKNEDRLEGLLKNIENEVYALDADLTFIEVRKMLDMLYAKAYDLSDQAYDEMQSTFPKY